MAKMATQKDKTASITLGPVDCCGCEKEGIYPPLCEGEFLTYSCWNIRPKTHRDSTSVPFLGKGKKERGRSGIVPPNHFFTTVTLRLDNHVKYSLRDEHKWTGQKIRHCQPGDLRFLAAIISNPMTNAQILEY